MLRIFRFLLTGDWHLHKWETIEELTVGKINQYTGKEYNNTGLVYVMRCSVCGEIKQTRI